MSSAVAQPCGPLGLLLWEVSHRYPVVDGTRPGVAMVVGHARCALQYAAAVVERADHVPFALPPCHSTAVPQRAGALPDHLRSPVPLGRPRGGKTSGKSFLFRQSGSTLGRPGEGFFRKSRSTPGPPRGGKTCLFLGKVTLHLWAAPGEGKPARNDLTTPHHTTTQPTAPRSLESCVSSH